MSTPGVPMPQKQSDVRIQRWPCCTFRAILSGTRNSAYDVHAAAETIQLRDANCELRTARAAKPTELAQLTEATVLAAP